MLQAEFFAEDAAFFVCLPSLVSAVLALPVDGSVEHRPDQLVGVDA